MEQLPEPKPLHQVWNSPEPVQMTGAEFVALFMEAVAPTMEKLAKAMMAMGDCFDLYLVLICRKYNTVSGYYVRLDKIQRRRQRHYAMAHGKHGLKRPRDKRNV